MFGVRPVCNLGYNRSVYKSEFDIFKRNTDIELISLLSLDEDVYSVSSKPVSTRHTLSNGSQCKETTYSIDRKRVVSTEQCKFNCKEQSFIKGSVYIPSFFTYEHTKIEKITLVNCFSNTVESNKNTKLNSKLFLDFQFFVQLFP